MADLLIEKSGFDLCIESLTKLAADLAGMSIQFDHSARDTLSLIHI